LGSKKTKLYRRTEPRKWVKKKSSMNKVKEAELAPGGETCRGGGGTDWATIGSNRTNDKRRSPQKNKATVSFWGTEAEKRTGVSYGSRFPTDGQWTSSRWKTRVLQKNKTRGSSPKGTSD